MHTVEVCKTNLPNRSIKEMINTELDERLSLEMSNSIFDV